MSPTMKANGTFATMRSSACAPGALPIAITVVANTIPDIFNSSFFITSSLDFRFRPDATTLNADTVPAPHDTR
jgi:hypothetical protein